MNTDVVDTRPLNMLKLTSQVQPTSQRNRKEPLHEHTQGTMTILDRGKHLLVASRKLLLRKLAVVLATSTLNFQWSAIPIGFEKPRQASLWTLASSKTNVSQETVSEGESELVTVPLTGAPAAIKTLVQTCGTSDMEADDKVLYTATVELDASCQVVARQPTAKVVVATEAGEPECCQEEYSENETSSWEPSECQDEDIPEMEDFAVYAAPSALYTQQDLALPTEGEDYTNAELFAHSCLFGDVMEQLVAQHAARDWKTFQFELFDINGVLSPPKFVNMVLLHDYYGKIAMLWNSVPFQLHSQVVYDRAENVVHDQELIWMATQYRINLADPDCSFSMGLLTAAADQKEENKERIVNPSIVQEVPVKKGWKSAKRFVKQCGHTLNRPFRWVKKQVKKCRNHGRDASNH